MREIFKCEPVVLKKPELFSPNEWCVVIMCGGLGSRLRGITGDKMPKHLIQVSRTQKLIDIPLMSATKSGIGNVVLATSGDTIDPLLKYTRMHNDLSITPLYSVEDNPVGVLQGLLQALESPILKDKNILLFHGDEVVIPMNILDFINFHSISGSGLTGVSTTDSLSGNNFAVWANPITGKVERIERHPIDHFRSGGATFTGLFAINQEILHNILKFEPRNWESLLRLAQSKGQLSAFKTRAKFFNTNEPSDLVNLRNYLHY